MGETTFALFLIHEAAVMAAAALQAEGTRRHISYIDDDELDRFGVAWNPPGKIIKVTVEFVDIDDMEEE